MLLFCKAGQHLGGSLMATTRLRPRASPPPTPILLHWKGMRGKRARRGSTCSALARGHEAVLRTQKGFLPPRGQIPTMHIREKGNGGRLIWMVGEAAQANPKFNLLIITVKLLHWLLAHWKKIHVVKMSLIRNCMKMTGGGIGAKSYTLHIKKGILCTALFKNFAGGQRALRSRKGTL